MIFFGNFRNFYSKANSFPKFEEGHVPNAPYLATPLVTSMRAEKPTELK